MRRLRRIVAATAIMGVATIGLAISATPANAMTKPSVTFGCGTVTVTWGGISETLPILPCPGPVI